MNSLVFPCSEYDRDSLEERNHGKNREMRFGKGDEGVTKGRSSSMLSAARLFSFAAACSAGTGNSGKANSSIQQKSRIV